MLMILDIFDFYFRVRVLVPEEVIDISQNALNHNRSLYCFSYVSILKYGLIGVFLWTYIKHMYLWIYPWIHDILLYINDVNIYPSKIP